MADPESIALRTTRRVQIVDVTRQVREAVARSGVREGICVVSVPHTTAGVTLNENADPDVSADLEASLARLAPPGERYRHAEGNSDAHVKASLVGSSVALILREGAPLLGAWQGVRFCEFDGPRSRTLHVKCMAG